MKKLAEITPAAVNFYPVLRWLRDADTRNVGGIEWARVYITTEGNALAVYKARGKVSARSATGSAAGQDVDVVQFYEERPEGNTIARDFFPVDFRNLHARDGLHLEEARARETFALGVVLCPLQKKRAVPLSLRFKPAWR